MRQHVLPTLGRFLIFFASIFTAQSAFGQQGEYHFGTIEGIDATADITVGWDYIRVTYKDSKKKSWSEAYASTPNFNFSFGDWDHFWISRSTNSIKFLGKFSITKKRFVYIRINQIKFYEN